MKYILSILIFSAAITGFSSCESGGAEVEPSSDSTYVYYMKVVSNSIYGYRGGDTYFYYDAQKRMSAFTVYADDGSGNPGQVDSTTIFYQGNSPLPARLTTATITNGVAAAPHTRHFFSYDGQNRKIRDSAISFDDTFIRVVLFKYDNTKVFGETRSTFPTLAATYYKWDTATLKANGDILTGKTYITDNTISPITANGEFTYDNYNSPFGKSALYHALWGFTNDGGFEMDYVGKSNFLTYKSVVTNPAVFTDIITYEHQYNLAGYPVKTTMHFSAGGHDEIYYYYKAL